MSICVWIQTFPYHSLSTGQLYCPGSILLRAFTVLHQVLFLVGAFLSAFSCSSTTCAFSSEIYSLTTITFTFGILRRAQPSLLQSPPAVLQLSICSYTGCATTFHLQLHPRCSYFLGYIFPL